MHWATHGHTAAEIIIERANAKKDFMGLTTFDGDYPTKEDAEIAKNYLSKLVLLDFFVCFFVSLPSLYKRTIW